MPLTNSLIEQISGWLASSDILAEVRSEARNRFFGYDEPGEVEYLANTGEPNGRERRFLGWFGFYFKLKDERRPAEVAAAVVLSGQQLDSALKSIKGARYIQAITTMARPGKGVYLELENEEFEVDSRILSQSLHRDDVLCAHIVPTSRKRWLVCPGWLVWPTHFGPGIRSRLKRFQLDPIQVERFLQRRGSVGEVKSKIDYPRDKTLAEAVARMTQAAQAGNRESLVKSPDEWKRLVLSAMKSNDLNKFSDDVNNLVGNVDSLDELNKWLALAMNIWNTTPQPDRSGKTAYELSQERPEPYERE
jgi:hypothetical protein